MFAPFSSFWIGVWNGASTWKSMKPSIFWLISVFRLPTATGPFRLSTVFTIVTQPTFLAASIRPWVTRFAKGWVPENTS